MKSRHHMELQHFAQHMKHETDSGDAHSLCSDNSGDSGPTLLPGGEHPHNTSHGVVTVHPMLPAVIPSPAAMQMTSQGMVLLPTSVGLAQPMVLPAASNMVHDHPPVMHMGMNMGGQEGLPLDEEGIKRSIVLAGKKYLSDSQSSTRTSSPGGSDIAHSVDGLVHQDNTSSIPGFGTACAAKNQQVYLLENAVRERAVSDPLYTLPSSNLDSHGGSVLKRTPSLKEKPLPPVIASSVNEDTPQTSPKLERKGSGPLHALASVNPANQVINPLGQVPTAYNQQGTLCRPDSRPYV